MNVHSRSGLQLLIFQSAYFNAAKAVLEEIDSVLGSLLSVLDCCQLLITGSYWMVFVLLYHFPGRGTGNKNLYDQDLGFG